MIARLRARLAESDGYSLTEMLVVLAILGIVLAALVQLFVSASNAQADMNNRFQAQQNARLALDGLRREIHCASGVPTSTTTSITITLGAYCPSNTTGATASFTWCTKDKTGTAPPAPSAAPYTLWRYTGTSCGPPGTGRQWAGNLTTGAIFPTPAPVAPGSLGSISVDLPVDLTPGDAKQRYELQDDIVLRNTARP
jgi:prepilin-type N-terminal cleavage/methylation domain-containing protein